MKKKEHQHTLVESTEESLVAKYVIEDGSTKYDKTTAKDVFKVRTCACGYSETYDMERMKV